MKIFDKKLTELKPYEGNPRKNENAVEQVALSISEFGFKVPLVITAEGVIVTGHTRYKAAKKLNLKTVPCIIADDLTEDQIKAFRIIDNKVGELAEWDPEKLGLEIEALNTAGFDLIAFGFDKETGAPAETEKEEENALTNDFIVPPFSVLDTSQGYWQDRKKLWLKIIGDAAEAREGAKDLFKARQSFKEKIGENFREGGNEINASILDPVLCEVVYKWFTPNAADEDIKVFDTFAGGTGFGVVASTLGGVYTGIELREEQAAFNNARYKARGLKAVSINDDGRNVLKHLEENSQDLFFSCPPYYDLEVYSDKEEDASNQETYEDFYKILDSAFTSAAKVLKENRFAVVVCQDIRDKKGRYYGLPEDIISTFKRAGLCLYNKIVLYKQIGTHALFARRTMNGGRKVRTVHEEVLVFYKGDPRKMKEAGFDIMRVDEQFNNFKD